MSSVTGGQAVRNAAFDARQTLLNFSEDFLLIMTEDIPVLKPLPRFIGSVRPKWAELRDDGDIYIADFGTGRLDDSDFGIQNTSTYLHQLEGKTFLSKFYQIFFL